MHTIETLIQTRRATAKLGLLSFLGMIVFQCLSQTGLAATNTWNGAGVTGGTGSAYWDNTANYTGAQAFSTSNTIDLSSISSTSLVTLSSTTIGTINVSSIYFGTTSSTMTAPEYLVFNGTGVAGQTVLNLAGDIYLPTFTRSEVVMGSDLTLSLTNGTHNFRQSAPYGVLIINSKITGGGASASFATYPGSTTQVILTNNSNSFDGNLSPAGGGLYYTSINNTGAAAGTSALGTAVNSAGSISVANGGFFDYIGSGNQSTNRTLAVSGSAIIGNYATSPSTLTFNGAIGTTQTAVGSYNFGVSSGNTTVVESVLGNSTGTGTPVTGLNKLFGRTYYTADGTYTVGDGAGTLILTGANTYTGTTTVSAGTLQVGNGTTGSLNGTTGTALSMGGGKFVVNEAANVNQGMGTATFSAGDNTIQSINNGGTSFLTFSGIGSRSTGATANFVTTNGTNGVDNMVVITGQTAGAMGPAYFYGGNQYAWYDAGGYVRGINYGVDAGTAVSTGDVSVASTNNLLVTGNVTAEATGNTFNTIQLSGTSNFTLASSANMSFSGILKSGGGGSTISGGSGLYGVTAGAEMFFRVDSATDMLTIATAIKVNGLTLLVKSGDGTLVLSKANSYTGNTYINGGTLQVTDTAALPSGYSLFMSGGTLQWSAGNGSATTTNYRAIILLGAGTIQVDAGTNELALYSGANLASAGYNTLTVTGGGNLSFGTSTWQTSNIVGVGNIVKNGTGTLNLYGTGNTYTGATTVNNGTMRVYGVLASTSAVLVNGGTFNYLNSTSSLDRNVTVNGGTFKNNGANFTGLLTFNSGTLGGTNFTGVNLTGNNAIGAGKTLSPGNSPGTMTTGNVDFVNGGIYLWEINDLSVAQGGVAGTMGGTTGWDWIDGGSNTLNLSQISTHFTLQIDSLNALSGWNPNSNYTWTIATFGSISGFNVDSFLIDTTGFSENSVTGTFALTSDGTNLYLNYTAVPEPAAWSLCLLAFGLLITRRRFAKGENC